MALSVDKGICRRWALGHRQTTLSTYLHNLVWGGSFESQFMVLSSHIRMVLAFCAAAVPPIETPVNCSWIPVPT